ncbi:MAG: DUF5615 family PIN-like protein [Euryarchaeota archaeon]|nr:DUF5615 family PIN-like protein [Euryarchaeota archaeon]
MTKLSVLCDENVDKQVLTYLRKNGHSGEHVVDVLRPGVDDIVPYALENDLFILTKDDDFLAMDTDKYTGVLFTTITTCPRTRSRRYSEPSPRTTRVRIFVESHT